MSEIKIGKLSVKTLSSEEKGVYTDAANAEKEGTAYKFLLDGIGNFSIIIQLNEFDDGTAVVGLDGDYIGPRFLFTHLYSRLRIGINSFNDQKWCELRAPKLSVTKQNRFTAQKTDLDCLDQDFMFNDLIGTLKQFGIKDINTRESILNDSSNRKNQISAIWDGRSLVSPVVVFVLTRLVPLMNILVETSGALEDIIYYGPNSIAETSYNLDLLLLKDENSDLEFKKSAFFSYEENTGGENITHDLERNVVGMLNGIVDSHILIGIDKENNKVGISSDYQFVGGGASSWDSYLLTLRNSLINLLGIGIVTNHISIGWHDIGEAKNNPVVDIFIRPLPEGFELAKDRHGEIWIRSINGTQKPYTLEQLEEYKRLRKIK